MELRDDDSLLVVNAMMVQNDKELKVPGHTVSKKKTKGASNVNISLVDAVKNAPKYVSFLKKFRTKKTKAKREC